MTGSTMLNNRNSWVGDNVANLKMCYETNMSPFEWIAGVGLASVVALQSAQYLSEQGVVNKNWGRGGAAPSREEAVTPQVTGTQETTSLKQELKSVIKNVASAASEQTKATAKDIIRNTNVTIGIMPYSSPWYRPDYRIRDDWPDGRRR